jgi:hypothetical protein
MVVSELSLKLCKALKTLLKHLTKILVPYKLAFC